MAGTFTWTATTGTNDWNSGGSWFASAGTPPPAAGGQVFINQAGTYTVTVNGTTDPTVILSGTKAFLTFNDANATLLVEGAASGSAGLGIEGTTLNLNAGTVQLTGPAGQGGLFAWATASVAGLITGFGTIASYNAPGTWTFSAGGTADASGGRLDVGSSGNSNLMTVNHGNFVIEQSAQLLLDKYGALGSGSNAGTVTFNGGAASGTLAVNVTTVADYFTSNVFNATLDNMAVGGGGIGASYIDLVNAGSASVSTALLGGGTTIQVIDNSSTYDFGTNKNFTGDTIQTQTDGSGGLLVWVMCFAEGAHLLTDTGEMRVEDITEGTNVITLVDGRHVPQPVTWVGRRRLNIAAHPQPQLGAPVRIRRGAFGDNLPHRDLVVSPDHCLFVDNKLIPAKLLINDMTVVQERDTRFVTYYHIELARHSVVLAEGLPAESYLDTGNRAFFDNAGLALLLHPDFAVNEHLKCWQTDACAPLTVAVDAVKPVWTQLAERAATLGYQRSTVATTTDPDLRLVANGRAIRPVSNDANRYVFALPAGVSSIRLTSRASVPSYAEAYLDDWRALGVAIRGIVVRDSAGYTVLPPDHPNLQQGWHRVESDGAAMWRWMNGDAAVILPETQGPIMVEVDVGIAMTHVVPDAPAITERLAA